MIAIFRNLKQLSWDLDGGGKVCAFEGVKEKKWNINKSADYSHGKHVWGKCPELWVFDGNCKPKQAQITPSLSPHPTPGTVPGNLQPIFYE